MTERSVQSEPTQPTQDQAGPNKDGRTTASVPA